MKISDVEGYGGKDCIADCSKCPLKDKAQKTLKKVECPYRKKKTKK